MKKLWVMLVILLTTVSLTACRENLDAVELLARSHEAQEQADIHSMTLEMELQIDASMADITMEMPVMIRMEIESEERMRTDMNLSVIGNEIHTTTFLRDGYVYTETNEFGHVQQTRLAADTTEETEVANMFNFSALTENAIESSSASATDDGYRLELTLNMAGLVILSEELDIEIPVMGGSGYLGDFLMWESLLNEEGAEPSITLMMYLDETYLPISVVMTLEAGISPEEIGQATNATLNMRISSTVEEVTIDFPDWLDEANVSIDESELLGLWENGSGQTLRSVFDSADSVEFLVNGTMIITEDGQSETLDWQPSGPHTFIVDGIPFTHSVNGDILTIHNRTGNERSFYREDTSAVVEEEEDEVEDADDNEDPEDDETAAIGELTTLFSGEWLVGTDIPSGRYVVTGSNAGNFVIWRHTDLLVNEILDDGSFGVPSVTTYLRDGDEIDISGINSVTFTPVTDRTLTNNLSTGNWVVGLDIEAGQFEATTPSGSGNIVIWRGNSLRTNEILDDGSFGVERVRVNLANGDIITISGLESVYFE